MLKSRLMLLLVAVSIVFAVTLVFAEAGAAKFQVTQKMFVSGNELKPGVYEVKWEATGAEAAVNFMKQGDLIAKAQAKIEQSEKNYDFNSMVVGKDASGREAIKGLQFKGTKVRLVFE